VHNRLKISSVSAGKAAVFASIFAVSCARPVTIPPKDATPTSEAPPPAKVVELTEDERLLSLQLKRDIEHLSGKIGERNAAKTWELADASDYIALELEGMGLFVERSGYETADVAAQNLAVTIPGGKMGDEILLIGAHYDSPLKSAGKNAGATGTAALLALARLMKGARMERTLRLVFFAMGESPHGDGEGRGARHFGRDLVQAAKKEAERSEGDPLPTPQSEILGMVHLDRLGAVSALSQPNDPPLLIDVRATPGSERLADFISESLTDEPVTVKRGAFPVDGGGVDSDARALFESGIAVVAVSGPRGEVVQYESLARVVMRIRRGISRILVEGPTNDGMLTPLGSNLR
jgi:hypothetical protein